MLTKFQLAIGVADTPTVMFRLLYRPAVLSYYAGSLAVQLPVCYLMNKVSLNRVLPSIVVLKGRNSIECFVSLLFLFYLELHILTFDSGWGQILVSWALDTHAPLFKGFWFLSGAIDGSLLALLVTLTCSWFSSEQVSVRLLLWPIVGQCIHRLLNASIPASLAILPRLAVLGYVILCFFLATFGSIVIGNPTEVTWLAGYQKVFLTRRAAISKLNLGLGTVWRTRKV